MKAPKNHHFSSSASLNYRVAASVAEKTQEKTYVVEVIKLDIYAVKQFLNSSVKFYEHLACYSISDYFCNCLILTIFNTILNHYEEH